MKFLITGVAGFVGATLAREIIARDGAAEIWGIDDFSFGYRQRLADIEGKIRFVEGSVKDIDRLLQNEVFDVIVHCAAIAPLPECQVNSYRAIEQNVGMCGALTDYALRTGCRNVVFFSSGAVYESTTVLPTPEDVAINTSLVYPTTKHIAELYFEAMCRAHAINVSAIRLFNLYGPNQDYFRKQPPLIGYLLSCLINDQEASLYSSGKQRRDYIFIDDLVDLVLLAANRMVNMSDGGDFTVFNAGSGHDVSVNDIVATLEKISGRKLRITRNPARDYWDKYAELKNRKIRIDPQVIEDEVNKFTQASTTKTRQLFGWQARVSLDEGLESCYKFALKLFAQGNNK
jgi:nucleoside-diphosphate-sugar epimerase